MLLLGYVPPLATAEKYLGDNSALLYELLPSTLLNLATL